MSQYDNNNNNNSYVMKLCLKSKIKDLHEFDLVRKHYNYERVASKNLNYLVIFKIFNNQTFQTLLYSYASFNDGLKQSAEKRILWISIR